MMVASRSRAGFLGQTLLHPHPHRRRLQQSDSACLHDFLPPMLSNKLTRLGYIHPDLILIPFQVKSRRCTTVLLVYMANGLEVKGWIELAHSPLALAGCTRGCTCRNHTANVTIATPFAAFAYSHFMFSYAHVLMGAVVWVEE
jgi:hypothetical protein